jgi:branched-chain amino acid transport system substrate-binding protein
VVNAMKGWKAVGPRGPVEIDPQTRDIIENEHAMEVYRKPDGKLGERILGTIENVKDECKVLKVGRCK